MGLFNNTSKYIKFGEFTYSLNLSKLREICLLSSTDIGNKEIQIVQTYDVDVDEGLSLSQKIEHETKSMGGNLNGMVYEILKLFIITLLENTESVKEFTPTFGTTFVINTLLEWDILRKIE